MRTYTLCSRVMYYADGSISSSICAMEALSESLTWLYRICKCS